ncbi:morphogenetic protein [Vibrio aestuarianus]|uniref:morphogenetic protein n=1 Tax=Vibrio aestuarianus TaxID=28171 RepID=UPI001594134B|nr:morphogenetic protein [Vibrio aestuarianus]NGZ18007.1 morphogenetic protein [Vibrio aestuarianus]
MKHVPMIFNTAMVKALLDGRKTVTRRPLNKSVKLKLQDAEQAEEIHSITEPLDKSYVLDFAPVKVGDLIWVRETFVALGHNDYEEVSPRNRSDIHEFRYKASELDSLANENDWEVRGYHWRPSIHMPRYASRLTLKVTDVRIERVQEITPKQAVKEGFNDWTGFAFTWSSIYLNQGLGWGKNPYVWVIEFEVINQNVTKVAA